MHKSLTTVLATAALAVSACSAAPEATPIVAPPPAMASGPAVGAPAYVRMAGAGDLYEMESSRLVISSTIDPNVRGFAQMMIDHHARTTASLIAAARNAGMNPPPPQLDPAKADMMRELQARIGPERDRLYIKQQVVAHQDALALHGRYAQTGDVPALRTAAQNTLPIIEQHIADLQPLRKLE